jgi:hypothetical protein
MRKTIFENDIIGPKLKWPDRFASFFNDKVERIVSKVKINVNVCNGTRKVNVLNKNFMDRNSVRECILNLKIKNSEGWDRIPQRVLVDGLEVLL